MSNRNEYPVDPVSTKHAGGPWEPNSYGAPPPMGLPPGNVHYMPQPYGSGNMPVHMVPMVYTNPEVSRIQDWLAWSIINFFIGWIIGGILPLIFSLVCRSNKQRNNAQGARTMSVLALVFNILVTLGGLAGWINLIIFLVVLGKAATNPWCYPYCP